MAITKITHLGIDYGGTLTDPDTAIDPAFGCHPVTAAAVATLRLLRERGLRLILSSNNRANENRRLALRHAGIEDLFAAVMTSQDLGYDKPDPRFYAAVLQAADCPPAQVLFVGNNYRNDVFAPISHGMSAVLVRPQGRLLAEENPSFGQVKVIRFHELPDFLDALHSAGESDQPMSIRRRLDRPPHDRGCGPAL